MPRELLTSHLKQLVSYYPATDDQDAVKEALLYCQRMIDDTKLFTISEILQNNGIYSYYASINSTKKPKLLLQGHIDVVRCGSNPSYNENEKGTITGRGVWDMLFAIASYLTFVQTNKQHLKNLDIGILLTGDEEIGGFDGSGWLVEQGYGGETVFVPDSGEGFGDICVASKGAYNLDLVANGKSHHGSRPWEGDGAANKLILMIHELMDVFDDTDRHNSTITVTGFNSGGNINQGPERATAHLDIRFKDEVDLATIKNKINTICAHYGGGVSNVLHADNLKIDTTTKSFKKFIEIYESHYDKPLTYSKAHGGSDARFYTKSGNEVIMIRPNGGLAHTSDEYIDKQSLSQFYLLMEDFVLKTAKIK